MQVPQEINRGPSSFHDIRKIHQLFRLLSLDQFVFFPACSCCVYELEGYRKPRRLSFDLFIWKRLKKCSRTQVTVQPQTQVTWRQLTPLVGRGSDEVTSSQINKCQQTQKPISGAQIAINRWPHVSCFASSIPCNAVKQRALFPGTKKKACR